MIVPEGTRRRGSVAGGPVMCAPGTGERASERRGDRGAAGWRQALTAAHSARSWRPSPLGVTPRSPGRSHKYDNVL